MMRRHYESWATLGIALGLCVAAGVLLVIGCHAGIPGVSGGAGTLKVLITDKPYPFA